MKNYQQAVKQRRVKLTKHLLKNITALSIEAFHNATGGNGQAIRLAERLAIPVFNLFQDDAMDKLSDFVFKTELME